MLARDRMTGSLQDSQGMIHDLAEALRADIAGGPHCGHMSRAEVHRLGKTPWEIQQFVAEVRRGIRTLVRLAGEPFDAMHSSPKGLAILAAGERRRGASTGLSGAPQKDGGRGAASPAGMQAGRAGGASDVTDHFPPCLSGKEGLQMMLDLERAHGRCALVLSGGGSYGCFHLGIVRGLLKRGVLPKVIAGSSSGALIAALVCTRSPGDLDDNLMDDKYVVQNGLGWFSEAGALRMLRRLLKKGSAQGAAHFSEWLQSRMGDITFREAFELSGRALSICVSPATTHERAKLLNHVSSPNVLVRSAVAASCAFPMLFPAQDLLAKNSKGDIVPYAQLVRRKSSARWRDGCMGQDLPLEGLQETFNVNYIVASQANLFISGYLSTKLTVLRELQEADWLIEASEESFKDTLRDIERLVRNFPFLPKDLIGWIKLANTHWEGNITLVRPSNLVVSPFEILPAIGNVSENRLMELMHQGERACLEKCTSIECLIGIEQEIGLGILALSCSKVRGDFRQAVPEN